MLVQSGIELKTHIIGDVGMPEHEAYLAGLKEMVEKKQLKDTVKFIGPVPNRDILKYLHKADLFVSTSHTGSLDKAILEAMSAGLIVLSCNEAYESVLQGYKESLMFPKRDAKSLASKIENIIKTDKEERRRVSRDLREMVTKDHALHKLVRKIHHLYTQS
jgi:glycosyltransferase involved in cell wall biosynthesis